MSSVNVGGVRGRPSVIDLGRVDERNPAEIDQFIKEVGYRALWSKAAWCPFTNPSNPAEHEPNTQSHPACDQGMVYWDPQEIRVGMTSFSFHELYKEVGRFDAGMAQATFTSDIRPSYWDKLQLLDSTVRFTERIQRSLTGSIDKPKYKAVNILRVEGVVGPPTPNQTTYTGIPVPVAAPALLPPGVQQKQLVYSNYVLLANGTVEWTAGPQPIPGSYYVVTYEHNPVYIVLDLLHHMRDTRILSKTPQVYPPQLGAVVPVTPAPNVATTSTPPLPAINPPITTPGLVPPPPLTSETDVYIRLNVQALVRLQFMIRDESLSNQ